MGLFSEEFEKEERDFLKQTNGKISLEEIAHIRIISIQIEIILTSLKRRL